MKKIKLGLTIAAVTLSIANSAFASCLDVIPTNKRILSQEIRRAEIELSTSQEVEGYYKELASSAKSNNDLSKFVASASALPLALYSGGITGRIFARYAQGSFSSYAGLITTQLGSIATMVAPLTVDGYISVTAMKSYLKDSNLNEDEINDFIEEYKNHDNSKCSYADASKELNQLRNEVLDTDLDGSITNTIIDHVTLGRISRRSTGRLYALAKLQTQLNEAKVAELKKYKFE